MTVETVDPPADGRSGGLAVWIGLAVVGAAAAGLAATGPPKTAACRPRLGVHHLRPDEDLP